MPDFHREDDWWRNGQNLYLDNLEATGLYLSLIHISESRGAAVTRYQATAVA